MNNNLKELEIVGDEDELFLYEQSIIDRTQDALYEMLTNPNKGTIKPEIKPFKTYSPFGDIYKQVMGYS